MSNLVNHLQSLNNPFLDLQNMSKELYIPNNNDTTRLAVIDKLSSKVKKGGFVAIADPFGYEKSALLNIEPDLSVPSQSKIDHLLVESISRETLLESEWFFINDCELGLKLADDEQIILQLSPN
jgi:hypothetical protein